MEVTTVSRGAPEDEPETITDGARSAGDKRPREQQAEDEQKVRPASAVTIAIADAPLNVLSVAKLQHGMLVWLELCSVQGVALFSFVRVPLRTPRLFTSAGMSLTRAERLHVLGCGIKSKLVRLISLRLSHHLVPQSRRFAWQQLAHGIVRVVAQLAVAIRSGIAEEVEKLCASGQCAAAVDSLQSAIYLGHLPSRALAAWMHVHGREGVVQDHKRAFQLAEEGTRAGCHHCQGMLALCYWGGYGCVKNSSQSLKLARESCGKGSRYGQFVMGWLHRLHQGGPTYDNVRAAKFYALAAEQNLDGAQHVLADMYLGGMGVAPDKAEALRLRRLAAGQGHPAALYKVATCYERGKGVAADKDKAIDFYKRARAAGHAYAGEALERVMEDFGSESPAPSP